MKHIRRRSRKKNNIWIHLSPYDCCFLGKIRKKILLNFALAKLFEYVQYMSMTIERCIYVFFLWKCFQKSVEALLSYLLCRMAFFEMLETMNNVRTELEWENGKKGWKKNVKKIERNRENAVGKRLTCILYHCSQH